MARNPYFKDYSGEQNLAEDLTIETIQTMGRDMVYVPRDSVTKDDLFGEYTTTKFKNGINLEMYVLSVDGFEGEGDIISQYGLQIKDRVDLLVAKKRFEEEVKLITGLTRPREGDLIFFPLSKTLFEINFVEHENPFYQLGKLYTYRLSCEVFTYEIDQEIDTGIEDIDSVEDERKQFAIRLTLGTNNGSVTDYRLGERVSTSTTPSASGTVSEWNLTTKSILVSNLSGTFDTSSNLVGDVSGADYAISTVTTTNIIIPQDPQDNNTAGDNDDLEFYADRDNIFDFTNTDPFSEGDY
tara:strand:+ start:380 stop:1270 length:891 start_codon:yes stop_codon:yes gene_type:complete